MMIKTETHAETASTVMPGPDAARMLRAVCDDCGAHASVVAAGASLTGACTVCGSGRLHRLDDHTPPPQRWTL